MKEIKSCNVKGHCDILLVLFFLVWLIIKKSLVALCSNVTGNKNVGVSQMYPHSQTETTPDLTCFISLAFNRLRCGICLVGIKTCSHNGPFQIGLDTSDLYV